MKFAWFIYNQKFRTDARLSDLLKELQAAGCDVYEVKEISDVTPGTDALLSFGGDGTFLSAARLALPANIPVIGVHLGRLGFLSENKPEDVAGALLGGNYTIESREMLEVRADGVDAHDFWPYALNEVTVMRSGASMLGIDVAIDGIPLPTYWADGLLVATSSGSTAYSLSVGGPICAPESKVLIVSPVSPHNLNVRPLIVPASTNVSISLRSREDRAIFTIDNRNYSISSDARLEVRAAARKLKRIRLDNANFYKALRSRLLWGEDVRNSNER